MTNLTSSHNVETAWRDYGPCLNPLPPEELCLSCVSCSLIRVLAKTTAFFHIINPEIYSLPPNKGVKSGTENIYMLSAHHQLHCLKKLHLAFVGLAHESAAKVLLLMKLSLFLGLLGRNGD